VDAFRKYEGRQGIWGTAESPLVISDKVIYTPGGDLTTMVALDKSTGEPVWQTESLRDKTAYVSPQHVQRGELDIIVGVTASYIFGVNAADGTILWKYEYLDLDTPTFHPEAPLINTNTPLYHDGRLFITSGYDHTGVMFEISEDGKSIEMVWKNNTLDNHHGGVVLIDGYIYGANWIDNSNGNWCCIDWQTGETKYEQEWNNKGSVLYADGMMYVYEERRGNVAMVKPDPAGFEVVSSFRVRKGQGPHWAHPAIGDGRLYIRHGKVLMAYDISESGNN
jgi:outer membrane protein assembly factor BamB